MPDQPKLKTLRMNLLSTDWGPLDALQVVGDGLHYAELLGRSVRYDVGGLEVRALDLETLIETKAHANRPKDRRALLQLRRLLELRRSAGDEGRGH